MGACIFGFIFIGAPGVELLCSRVVLLNAFIFSSAAVGVDTLIFLTSLTSVPKPYTTLD